ncbi:MAG: hypothetical protein PWP66_273 [Thermosediminibacterales bacterium]|nr:hypothetical protein [Thermosediminibacterales bacterium]
MPKTGDAFTITLKEVHLNWGTKSSKGVRCRSELEVYIPIPIKYARKFDIKQGAVFDAESSDGFYNHGLLAGGSQGDNYQYGKNFESKGDLEKLGEWLKDYCKAEPGDKVEVRWTSPNKVRLTHIPKKIK